MSRTNRRSPVINADVKLNLTANLQLAKVLFDVTTKLQRKSRAAGVGAFYYLLPGAGTTPGLPKPTVGASMNGDTFEVDKAGLAGGLAKEGDVIRQFYGALQ